MKKRRRRRRRRTSRVFRWITRATVTRLIDAADGRGLRSATHQRHIFLLHTHTLTHLNTHTRPGARARARRRWHKRPTVLKLKALFAISHWYLQDSIGFFLQGSKMNTFYVIMFFVIFCHSFGIPGKFLIVSIFFLWLQDYFRDSLFPPLCEVLISLQDSPVGYMEKHGNRPSFRFFGDGIELNQFQHSTCLAFNQLDSAESIQIEFAPLILFK